MRVSKQSVRNLGGLGLMMAVLALSAGCGRQPPAQAEPGQTKQTAPKVTTAKPVRKTFIYKIDGPGEIQADEQTPMFAKITGYVQKINKDIGDPVKEGEVLAELSVPEMDEELIQKEAMVIQAKAEHERAKKLYSAAVANLQFTEAKVEEAIAGRPRALAEKARADSQYERLKNTTGAIAGEAISETKLGAEAAKAAVLEVEAKIKSAAAWHVQSAAQRDTAFSDISVAEARLRVAQASLRTMTELLKYAKLSAPYTGVVTKRNVDLGYFIQSSASGTKGEPVFVVARTDPVRIYVDVQENDAVLVTDGTKAVVRVQAIKGEEFKGAVKRSSWALDPKSRILRTEIDLPNPAGKLRPGMYAYATITVVHEKVWAAPVAAVVTKDDQTYCWFVESGKARRTSILVGFRDGQFVEIRKLQRPGEETAWEDVTGKEIIITGNLAGLSDGQAVDLP